MDISSDRRNQRNEMGNLVLISGATGGLGKAFAVECASRGWNLFLTDLNTESLEALAQGLRGAYRVKVNYQSCDLTDPESRSKLFRRIQADGRRFWFLINVAGVDFEGPFYEQSRQKILTLLRLNIEGTLEMTHALLAYRDPGAPFHILNVASMAAFYPMPVKAMYAASKRFLLDFSLALQEEVRGLGATVTVLCPAGLPTTPECIQGIEVQGLMGFLTTQNTGPVVDQALNGALLGKPIVIPGRLNRALQMISSLAPTWLVVRLIGMRWKSARQKCAVKGSYYLDDSWSATHASSLLETSPAQSLSSTMVIYEPGG